MTKRTVFNLAAAKRQSGTKAQILEVDYPEKRLPPCSWCRKKKLKLRWEYIQEGIWWDDFLLICVCMSCMRATVIVYQSEEDKNVEP
jgi:hypothetical protein